MINKEGDPYGVNAYVRQRLRGGGVRVGVGVSACRCSYRPATRFDLSDAAPTPAALIAWTVKR